MIIPYRKGLRGKEKNRYSRSNTLVTRRTRAYGYWLAGFLGNRKQALPEILSPCSSYRRWTLSSGTALFTIHKDVRDSGYCSTLFFLSWAKQQIMRGITLCLLLPFLFLFFRSLIKLTDEFILILYILFTSWFSAK